MGGYVYLSLLCVLVLTTRHTNTMYNKLNANFHIDIT